MKSNSLGIRYSAAAKNIESTADGCIQPVPSQLLKAGHISYAFNTAGIGGWNSHPAAKFFCQFLFNAGTFSFHVNGMDQKLLAKGGKIGKCLFSDSHRGKILPGRLDSLHFR